MEKVNDTDPFNRFILGVILGPMADSNLRRAIRLHDGSFATMFERPICVFFLIVIVFMILSQTGLFKLFRKKMGEVGNQ
jgi:putative tricarboxylic transport membrane protein